MSKLLVTGSIAFDRISVFPDRFGAHILPNKLHDINVCFTVADMQVNYGGTGANLAYNLSLLGENPILLAAIGKDGSEYLKYLKKLGVNIGYVKKSHKLLTANATIMTDLDDNQITSFYVGAMAEAGKLRLSGLKLKPELAIIAPNDVSAMQKFADYFFTGGIPFIADPGQSIPGFKPKDLIDFITGSHILIVNDYELSLIIDKTKMSQKEILERCNYLIVTYGSEGSKIWSDHTNPIKIPAFKAKKVTDPTGSGDAYRAGLMYGYKNGYDIEKSALIGSWLAVRCVEKQGTQNHKISKTDFTKFLKKL